jgi:hypothetical protein
MGLDLMSDNKPSRFHASPAQIDAFLREHFAEDALLNFYRAVGDEVLDEAITYGKQHRGLMESRNCKHLYLSGMADVMDAIWDFRYYPAKLPSLTTYDLPFNRPTPSRRGLHPENSTFHPDNTRLPSPKEGTLNVFVQQVADGWDAVRDDDRSHIVAVAYTLPDLMDKLKSSSVVIHVVNPPSVTDWGRSKVQKALEASAAPQSCYRTKTHDAHKWLKGRKAVQCSGIPKETP